MNSKQKHQKAAPVALAEVAILRRVATPIALATLWTAAVPASAQTVYRTATFQPRTLPWSGPSYTPTSVGSAHFGYRRSDVGGTQFLGRLSTNPYAADSIGNSYCPFGSPYSSTSVANPYGRYGSPYSPVSATNPYTVNAPRLYGADGTYLGKLSANRFDADSISNPFGQYGSQYGADSVNNPYGRFGSRHSALSATNPYAVKAPLIFGN